MNNLDIPPQSQDVHIAGLIVQAQPAYLNKVIDAIDNMEAAEIHAQNEAGKLVVCMTAESSESITEHMDAILSIQGTLNVVLVYHQIEDSRILDERI